MSHNNEMVAKAINIFKDVYGFEKDNGYKGGLEELYHKDDTTLTDILYCMLFDQSIHTAGAYEPTFRERQLSDDWEKRYTTKDFEGEIILYITVNADMQYDIHVIHEDDPGFGLLYHCDKNQAHRLACTIAMDTYENTVTFESETVRPMTFQVNIADIPHSFKKEETPRQKVERLRLNGKGVLEYIDESIYNKQIEYAEKFFNTYSINRRVD